MRAPRTAEAMATMPNCMLRALQPTAHEPADETCAATSYFFGSTTPSSQHHTLVAMSHLVQRCSPTTGRMPRSILGLTAGALSGWAVWRISSMRTHTTL